MGKGSGFFLGLETHAGLFVHHKQGFTVARAPDQVHRCAQFVSEMARAAAGIKTGEYENGKYHRGDIALVGPQKRTDEVVAESDIRGEYDDPEKDQPAVEGGVAARALDHGGWAH